MSPNGPKSERPSSYRPTNYGSVIENLIQISPTIVGEIQHHPTRSHSSDDRRRRKAGAGAAVSDASPPPAAAGDLRVRPPSDPQADLLRRRRQPRPAQGAPPRRLPITALRRPRAAFQGSRDRRRPRPARRRHPVRGPPLGWQWRRWRRTRRRSDLVSVCAIL